MSNLFRRLNWKWITLVVRANGRYLPVGKKTIGRPGYPRLVYKSKPIPQIYFPGAEQYLDANVAALTIYIVDAE